MANKTNKKRKRKHQLRGITKQRKEDNIANSSTIRPTSTSGDDKRSVHSTVTNDTRTSSLSSDEEKSSECMDVSASQTKIGNKLKSMDNIMNILITSTVFYWLILPFFVHFWMLTYTAKIVNKRFQVRYVLKM